MRERKGGDTALSLAQPLRMLLRVELGLDVVVAAQQPFEVLLARDALLLSARLDALAQRAHLLVLPLR